MRLSKTLAVILLCAATLTLSPAADAAAHPSQKPRPGKAQTPAPQTTEITKEKIEAIVNAIQRAAKAKDAAGIIPYLAPDLSFKSHGEGRPFIQGNRAQYIASLKFTFEHALDYTLLLKSLNVTIAPDGQSATAESEMFEMITFAQGTVAASVVSTTTFKIYKGKVLISSMDGTVTHV